MLSTTVRKKTPLKLTGRGPIKKPFNKPTASPWCGLWREYGGDLCNVGVDTVSWGYGFEIEYTDWLIQASQDGTPTVDILFDGTLQLSAVNDTSLGTTSFSVSGGPFTIDDRLSGNDYTYSAIDIDHEVDTTTGDYTTVVNEISLTSSNLGGEVTASTQDGDPFVGSGGYPTDGTLVISGANGSQAIVDAGQCGDAEFDLTINGSGEGCKAWESGI